MIIFKSYRRLYFKFFQYLDDWRIRNRKSIISELEKISLRETVEYVMQHMENAVAVTSPFEMYDYVLKKITVQNGLYCEFGVWKGTSINYMAKKTDAVFHGFDSFEGLPEYWRSQFDESRFNLEGNLPKVEKNVELHKGWFNETLPGFLEKYKGPLALLHVDSDLYSSAKTIFDLMRDRIVPGTIIVFDEYFNYPFWKNHEHKAFLEFIGSTGLRYEYISYNELGEQAAVVIL